MAYDELPFDSSLVPSLEKTHDRIDLKKAAMIVIDGGVGEGKTTLAHELAKFFMPGFMDHCDKLTGMGGVEFMRAIEYAVRMQSDRKVVIYDEAGDFNSRGSLTEFNQRLNRVFETYRQTKILVILCLPMFIDVDKSLFKKKIPRMVINCYGRTEKYGRYRVYSLWRSWYLRAKMAKLTVPDDAYGLVDPNLYGQFKDLPPAEARKIDDISIKGKKSIIKEAYLAEKGLMRVDVLCKKTGYSKSSIYAMAKDLEPFREKHGNMNFYNKGAVRFLMNRQAEMNK